MSSADRGGGHLTVTESSPPSQFLRFEHRAPAARRRVALMSSYELLIVCLSSLIMDHFPIHSSENGQKCAESILVSYTVLRVKRPHGA